MRWYLRYGLSYRDVEELLAERGVEVDHVTLFRWVQRFTPLLVDAGIRTFIDLTTPNDPLEPYAPVITEAATARQLDLLHINVRIPDLGVLTDDEYDPILELIGEQKQRGGVYVHCWGGVGRTGTVIGSLLARQGHDYPSIMSTLEDLRAGTKKANRPCPETEVQLHVLRRRSAP